MSFDFNSFTSGFGNLVSQVNDLKTRLEQQMDAAMEEEDPNAKTTEPESPQSREKYQPPSQDSFIPDPKGKNDVVPLKPGATNAGLTFEFESLLGKSSELISKAVSGWNEQDEDEIEISSTDEEALAAGSGNVTSAPSSSKSNMNDIASMQRFSDISSIKGNCEPLSEDTVPVTYFTILATASRNIECTKQRELVKPVGESLCGSVNLGKTSNKKELLPNSSITEPVSDNPNLATKPKMSKKKGNVVLHQKKPTKVAKKDEFSHKRIKELEFLVQQREKQLEKQVLLTVDLEKQVESLQVRNSSLETSVSSLSKKQNEVNDLIRENEILQTENKEIETKCNSVLAEGMKLSKKNGDLELNLRKMKSEKSSLENKFSTLETKFNALEEKRSALMKRERETGDELKRQMKKSEIEKVELEEKVKVRDKEITALKVQLTEQINSGRIRSEQQTIAEKEMASLKAEVLLERKQSKEIETRLTNEVKSLKKRLNSLGGRELDKEEKEREVNSELQQRNIVLMAEIEKLNQRNDEILLRNQTEKSKTIQKIVESERKLDDLTNELKVSSEEVSTLKNTNSELSEKLAKREEIVNDLEVEVANLAQVKTALELKLQQKEEKILYLTSQIEESEKKHQLSRSEIEKKLNSKISLLEGELSSAKQDVESYKAEIENLRSLTESRALSVRSAKSGRSFNDDRESLVSPAVSTNRPQETPHLTQSEILRSLNLNGASDAATFIPRTIKSLHGETSSLKDYNLTRRYSSRSKQSVPTAASAGDLGADLDYRNGFKNMNSLHDDDALPPTLRITNLKTLLRLRTEEVGGLKQQLNSLERSKTQLMQDLDEANNQLSAIPNLETEVTETKKKLDVVLKLLGEKEERIEDLTIEVKQSKQAFTSQIEFLASQLEAARSMKQS